MSDFTFSTPSGLSTTEDPEDKLIETGLGGEQPTASSAPLQSNVFDFKVPDNIQRDERREQIITDDAVSTDPDKFKANKDIADETGLPLQAVEQDDGTLNTRLQGAALRKKLRNNKFAREWFNKPDNARLSHDDIDALDILSNSAKAGYSRAMQTSGEVQQWVDIITKSLSAPSEYFLSNPLDVIFGDDLPRKEMPGLATAVQQLADGVAEILGMESDFQGSVKAVRDPKTADKISGVDREMMVDVKQVLENPANYPQFIAETTAQSLPETALAILAAPISLMAINSRLAADRAKNDGREEPVLLDLIQVMPESAAVLFLDRLGGKAMVGFFQDVLKEASFKGVISSIFRAGVKEGGTEAIQEPLETLATTRGTKKGLASAEEFKMAAIGGALGGFGMGGSIRSVTAPIEARVMAKQIKQRSKIIKGMNAQESRLRERSPSSYAEYQGGLMKYNGVESVGLSDDGRVLLQEVLDDPESTIDPALREILQKDVTDIAAGAGVQLSPEQFWALPKETIDTLADHVQIQADPYSAAEAQEIAELTAMASTEGFSEEVQKRVAEVDESTELFVEIQDRITAAGGALTGDPAATRAAAQQMTAAFTTLAERSGIPLQTIRERFLPRIAKESAIIRGPMTFEQAKKGFRDERIPELETAARQREAGEITAEDYQAVVDQLKPVLPYETAPEPSTVDEMRAALKSGQQDRVGKGGQFIGDPVGLRLDIPAYTNYNTWVPTMHDPKGKPIAHEAAAKITGVSFTQPGASAERKAARVGTGDVSKSPFAQINGTLQSVDPASLKAEIEAALNDPEWTQVGYDPRRHTFFYDRKTQTPVLNADEVIQVGPLVLAKNAQFGQAQEFLFQEQAAEYGVDAETLRAELDAAGGDITQTAAFKAWFGDSKVVDADGKPLVVYHGSVARGLESFDTSLVTERGTGDGDAAGTYFSASPQTASGYTTPQRAVNDKSPRPERGAVYSVYLSIKNPLDTTKDIKKYQKAGMSFGDAKRKALEKLDRAVHDGIIFRGNSANTAEYVVFDPTQIKSVNNRGTFDPNDPRILNQDAADPLQEFTSSQSEMSIDDMYADTDALVKELGDALTQIAEQVPDVILKPAEVKKRGKIEDKVKRKNYTSHTQITDVVRGALVTPGLENSGFIVEQLRDIFGENNVLDEGWGVTPALYMDRKVLVRLSNGLISEVQLATQKMWDSRSKSGGNGHGLYTAARSLPAGPERAALFEQMQALYSEGIIASGSDAVGIVERSAYGNLFAKASSEMDRPLSATSAKSTLTQDASLDTIAKEEVSSAITAGRPSQSTNNISSPPQLPMSTIADQLGQSNIAEVPGASRKAPDGLAEVLKQQIKDNPEGFTMSLDGTDTPLSGFAFAPLKQTEIVLDTNEISDELINKLVSDIQSLMQSTDRDVYAGGWFDPITNKYYLDASFIFDNKEDALYAAAAADQLAIFDLGEFQDVGTQDALKSLRQDGTYSAEALNEQRGNQAELSRRFEEIRFPSQRPLGFFQEDIGNTAAEEMVEKAKAALTKIQEPKGGMGGTSITRLYNDDYPKQRGADGRFEVRKGHRKSKLEISQEIHAERVEGRDTWTDENAAIIGDIMAIEALHAIMADGNAATWYRDKVEGAMKVAALVHPEIAYDARAATAFKFILAITSNGSTVTENSVNSFKVYESIGMEDYLPGGKKHNQPIRIPPAGFGKEVGAMKKAFEMWNEYTQEMGVDEFIQFLNQDFTAGELKKAGYEVSGELVSEPVKGSVIFGSKIGGGFFQNLNGNFNSLTMDLWFMRSWGRWSGTLIPDIPASTKAKRFKRLRDMLTDSKQRKLSKLKVKLPTIEAAKKMTDDELGEIANLILRADSVDKGQGTFAKTTTKVGKDGKVVPARPELHLAAQRVSEGAKKVLDAPSGGGHRHFMRKAAAKALDALAEQGINLDLADLQALLWYPEKDLSTIMGNGTKRTAPTDYETEFSVLAKKGGFSDADIQGTILRDTDGSGEGTGSQPGQTRRAEDAGLTQGQGPRTTADGRFFLDQGAGGKTTKPPRGSIDFNNMQDIVIRLYDAENLSTFLHESGHLYLEMLGALAEDPDAPQQIKDDFDTALKWLGVGSRSEIGREQHETWAETFEQYLREGKAPSVELQTAFAKFTAWLTTIYRQIKKMGKLPRAALNEEISGVMDRMLATDDQIAQVRDEQRIAPIFKDAESGNMTEVEYAAYVEDYDAARASSQAELVQESLAEIRREKTKWWRDGLQAETNRVLATLDKDPVWTARHVLQGTTMPSGGAIPEVYPPSMKLDRKMVEDSGYSIPGGNQIVRKTGGVSPERAAQDLGFTSGDELLQVLSMLPKNDDGQFLTAKQFADKQARQSMLDMHGDMMDPATLHEEALSKVHSRKQAEVILQELRTLNKMSNQPNRVTHRIMQQAATRAVSEKTYAEIGSPTKYLSAERRYSMKAAEALVAGDMPQAIQFKTQQLLNFHMYRAVRDARATSDKMIDRMKKWQSKKIDPKTNHPEFIKQLKQLLQDVNFQRIMSENRISQLSVKAMQDWAEKQNETYGVVFHISPALDAALSKDNVYNMTFSEIEGLHDTAKSLAIQARRYSQAEDAQFDQLVSIIAQSVDDNAKKTVVIPEDRGWLDKGGSFVRMAFAEHRQMLSLSEELDGGETGGSVYSNIYQRIKRADDKYIDRSMEASEVLNDLLASYSPGEKLQFYKRQYIPEIDRSLSLNARLSFALNMGNEGNVKAMQNSYSDDQIDAILATLTDKDWDVVEAMWKHIDSYWSDLSSLEERTTGVRPKKVEPTAFTLPSGRVIKGGYYPLVMDPQRSQMGKENYEASQSLKAFTNGGRAKVSTKHGSTIERTGFGDNPPWLDLRVAFDHVDGVIRDIEMREAVADVVRITRNKKVSEAIRSAKGPEFMDVINSWVENTVGASKPPITTVEKMAQYARTGASIAEMGLSLRTVLMQPFGYFQSVGVLGEKYAVIGLAQFAGQRGDAAKRVMSASAFMRNRSRTFNREVREVGRWMGKKGLQNKVVTASFWGIQKLDMSVSIPTWLGAYQKAIDGGMTTDNAIDFADQTVSRTQGSGLPRDMADIQQGAVWKKMFTMFYNFFGAYHNMQTDQWKNTNFKNSASALKFAKNQLWLTIIPALVVDAIFNELPKDEDEWPLWATKSLARYMTGGIVLLRDAVNTATTGFSYQVTPAGNPIKEFGNLVNQIGQGENDAALWKSLVMFAGYSLQLPGVRGVSRGISVIDDNFEADEFESWWRLLVMGPERD